MHSWVMCVCRSIVPEENRPLSYDVTYIVSSPCTHLWRTFDSCPTCTKDVFYVNHLKSYVPPISI